LHWFTYQTLTQYAWFS
jgi:DDE superfamily endonuclease